MYPDHLVMAVENGVARRNCNFTQDILNCYLEWRTRAAAKNGGTIDQCVWGNKEITGMWNKTLQNSVLLNKGILYISHFLSNERDRSLLSYDQFCNKWNLGLNDITFNEYSDMRLAIKGYSRTTSINDNFNLIAEDVNAHSIVSIKTSQPIKAGGIRSQMNLYVHPNSLTPLKEWYKDLETENIDWVAVFNNTFISITNNYQLIQFQYKLLMRISTSVQQIHEIQNEYCTG